jgi:hypothetical protein
VGVNSPKKTEKFEGSAAQTPFSFNELVEMDNGMHGYHNQTRLTKDKNLSKDDIGRERKPNSLKSLNSQEGAGRTYDNRSPDYIVTNNIDIELALNKT